MRTLQLRNTIKIQILDESGNEVDSFVMKSGVVESAPSTFDRPLITDLPAGESIDYYFAKSFDKVWGIMAFSDEDRVQFQIYNDSDAPYERGSFGKEFILVSVPETPLFSRSANSNWYFKVTNEQPSLSAKITVMILGKYERD